MTDPADLAQQEEAESVEPADSSVPAEPDENSDTPEAAAASADEPQDPLAQAQRERDEYLDHLRRERAEFENFRRRASKERMDALDRGAEQVVSGLLHVLDTFGFALAAASEHPEDQLAKGIEMVYAEFLEVLRKSGLEEIEGVGSVFDPTHHEAMMQVEAHPPIDEPTVVEVLRPGYRYKGRVLRPASVKVAK